MVWEDSGFPDSSVGKESTCSAGDPGLIPRLGRSPGEGNGYPLQYSGLETSMDCIVHGVTELDGTEWHFHFHWKDPTCCRATKPMCYNYGACTLRSLKKTHKKTEKWATQIWPTNCQQGSKLIQWGKNQCQSKYVA